MPRRDPRTAPSRRHALVLGAALLLAGCGGSDSGDGAQGNRADDPAPRTHAMGFFLVSPQPTEQSLLATVEAMAAVSDVVFWQEPVPWARLLHPSAPETIEEVATEKVTNADYFRSLGLDIAYLVDPLNGLDRREEAPELTALGRSIVESDIRALHEAWVLEIAERMQPKWLGLASEINTPGQHGDAGGDPNDPGDLYPLLVEMINGLVPKIRGLSPDTRVFVSFQVEDAHGLLIPGDGQGFDLVDDFQGLDAFGLSSYPLFAFDTPADIPDEHLARFERETDLPLLLVESGWSSADVQFSDGSPAEQADYVERYAELLDGVEAEMWINLIYADLDVQAFGFPPDEEETLLNFGRMGLVDQQFVPKPAFEAWKAIHERARAGD